MFWEIIATFFYSGRLPVMPGTWGTLFAAVLIYLFYPENFYVQAGIVFLTFILSVISSDIVSKKLGSKDPSSVVIDEVLGMQLSVTFMPVTLTNVLVAFAIFRFIDIIKPYPIKLAEKLPGGVGITVDDMIAGLLTNFVLRILTGWGVMCLRKYL